MEVLMEKSMFEDHIAVLGLAELEKLVRKTVGAPEKAEVKFEANGIGDLEEVSVSWRVTVVREAIAREVTVP